MKKVLIIRLSSIGDIIQCMSVVGGMKNHYPMSELHWIVRKDLTGLLNIDPRINQIWEFDRKAGLKGLIKLGFQLRQQGYSHIYDAHSNIRSNILKLILCPASFFKISSGIKLITRRKDRLKRFLLFSLRINLLPKPFKALDSFRNPLKKWGLEDFSTRSDLWIFPKALKGKVTELLPNLALKPTITLIPSAAWELKRWPTEYWIDLVFRLTDHQFIVLGGPSDDFCKDIENVAPDRVTNLAGKTSLMESFCVTYLSDYVISGDTGFLHAADLFNKNGIALIGPTAFGYPSGSGLKVMETDLPCRPCSKDGSKKCKLQEKKKCMMDLLPEALIKEIKSRE